ncbi:hypothetical protein [Methylocystis sp. JR02]|uniref:hypothetical protein n=1 Tax=Methylocystis sp. JR02 TaxID=3046284 RepID=UPI0024BBC524|nr:hypothetical protein [Methylocystis sp. JR02]MDJ0450577.1 hypothetical protein [Methylocystis sp. JR02]
MTTYLGRGSRPRMEWSSLDSVRARSRLFDKVIIAIDYNRAVNYTMDFLAHFKDIASIATPFIIAAFGFIINSTIQKQNKLAERSSALAKQWADEFAKSSSDIDEKATSVVATYFKLKNKDSFVTGDIDEELKKFDQYIRDTAYFLAIERLRLEKFVPLAPRNGDDLLAAFDELHKEILTWFSNKGGDVEKLRAKQAKFNSLSRRLHREILELD